MPRKYTSKKMLRFNKGLFEETKVTSKKINEIVSALKEYKSKKEQSKINNLVENILITLEKYDLKNSQKDREKAYELLKNSFEKIKKYEE